MNGWKFRPKWIIAGLCIYHIIQEDTLCSLAFDKDWQMQTLFLLTGLLALSKVRGPMKHMLLCRVMTCMKLYEEYLLCHQHSNLSISILAERSTCCCTGKSRLKVEDRYLLLQ